jgi:hypothetical protein
MRCGFNSTRRGFNSLRYGFNYTRRGFNATRGGCVMALSREAQPARRGPAVFRYCGTSLP